MSSEYGIMISVNKPPALARSARDVISTLVSPARSAEDATPAVTTPAKSAEGVPPTATLSAKSNRITLFVNSSSLDIFCLRKVKMFFRSTNEIKVGIIPPTGPEVTLDVIVDALTGTSGGWFGR